METPIYLDHSATSAMHPEVVEVVRSCLAAGPANPSSPHEAGRRARRRLDEARQTIASLLGAGSAPPHPVRVIFTSGGTEANNLAVLGMAGPVGARIAVSAVEHPSVLAPAEYLERSGWQVDRIAVDAQGRLVREAVEAAVDRRPRLLSVMLANNETGVLQPVAEWAAVCRRRGIALHTDAVQAAGKLDVDFDRLGVDLLTLSAHKFHGPPGIGAVLVRGDLRLERIVHGGEQEFGLRPGTPAVALACGMAAALSLWHAKRQESFSYVARLRDRFETGVRRGWPEAVVLGADADRLPHCCSVSFPGFDRQALLMALDLEGVHCAAGSACTSGSQLPSHVLEAMGCPQAIIDGALRFSFATTNSPAEIDRAVARLLLILHRIRRP